MSDAFHDANGVHTLIAVENDGATLQNVLADPVSHEIQISDGTTGSDNGPTMSRHDAGHVPILMATSNADGKTPIPVYSDTSGNLLVDSV